MGKSGPVVLPETFLCRFPYKTVFLQVIFEKVSVFFPSFFL